MGSGAYLEETRVRVRTAGYAVDLSGGVGQLAAYRSDFRWRWMATKLHTLVVVSEASDVTGESLAQFAESSLEWAKVVKGQLRGAQVGVGVIAALVADHADESAVEIARKKLVRGYAAFAWPVLVDLGSGQRASHLGRPAIGAVYSGWMRGQIDALLPAPLASQVS